MCDFMTFAAGNEKELMDCLGVSEELLPYPLKKMPSPVFGIVEYYDIPAEEKEKVLKELYPFCPVPKMDEVYYDIHQDKSFTIRDFMVIRDSERNYLVSPYYPLSGGTVIDWVLKFDDDGFVSVSKVK